MTLHYVIHLDILPSVGGRSRGRKFPLTTNSIYYGYTEDFLKVGGTLIKVFFGPQVSDNKIEYSFNGEIVTITIDGITDIFDFSSLPEGQLIRDDNPQEIETLLPVNPIISAKREDGILHLELLNWIGHNAPYESRFPEWVELPLPKKIEKVGLANVATIPWKSKSEIDAEQAERERKEQEKEIRRNRIREALLSDNDEINLKNLLKDVAVEIGLID